MITTFVGVVALILAALVFRALFGILLISALVWGVATNYHATASSDVLSYQELVDYPSQCAKADEQLAELRRIQSIKNFNPDPDALSEHDRAYNSRLKATIWWYAYRCDKS